MIRLALLPWLGLLLAQIPAALGDDVASGPDPGATPEPFRVVVGAGARVGQDWQPVTERSDRPTVYLFVQAENWDRPAARFLKTLDRELTAGIEGADGASAVVVWLTDDPEKGRAYLPVAQDSLGLEQSVWTLFEGGKDGPSGWSVNGLAGLTAVVVRGGQVVKSVGYQSLNEQSVPAVVASLRGPPTHGRGP